MKKYKIRVHNPIMGVPITFLDKYNPDEFEIINGMNRFLVLGYDSYTIHKDDERIGKHMCSIDNGMRFTYFRILIRRK